MAEEQQGETRPVYKALPLSWEIRRGLQPVKLAVLALLLSIGIGVGDWVEGRWWVQLLAAGGTAGALAWLLHNYRTRNWLFKVADWVVRDG